MDLTVKKTLGQSISIWEKTKTVRDTPLPKLLKTALKLYVFPEMGYEATFHLSTDEFRTFCYEVDLKSIEETKVFTGFDKAFQASINSGKVSLSTRGNYKWALKKFFNWLHAQSWYQEHLSRSMPTGCQKRVYAEKRAVRPYEWERFYGLKEKDLPEHIRHSLNRYELFWSQSNQNSEIEESIGIIKDENLKELKSLRLKQAKEEIQQGNILVRPNYKKSSESSLKRNRQVIKAFLGWCVHVEGYKPEEISLDWINHQAFYLDYIDWLIQKRNCGYCAAENLLLTSLSVAKYRTYYTSKKSDWSDIPLVRFIQQKFQAFRKLSKEEQITKQEEKWNKTRISHQQAREIANHLYLYCYQERTYPKGSQHIRRRQLSAFVAAWQIYLIVKFLVYAPVRQEELRKLQIGTTLKLVQDSQGVTRYAVRIKDHKRTSITRKPRYYPLPTILTNDITTWIEEIRPLAINAPLTLNSWLNFWGHSLEKLEKLKQKVQLLEGSESSSEKTLINAQNNVRGITRKINAFSTVQQNVSCCDHLFFTLGATYPSAFCQPWNVNTLSSLVLLAVSGATKALYGESRFLGAHSFRNTGAKHLRVIGRDEDKAAFSALLGHSIEIDDEYAAVLTDEFELLEAFVDDWWV